MSEVKTSDKWLKEMNESHPSEILIIHDPDGWDRKNYQYSFYEEEITKEEFNKRTMWSTIMKLPKQTDTWMMIIQEFRAWNAEWDNLKAGDSPRTADQMAAYMASKYKVQPQPI